MRRLIVLRAGDAPPEIAARRGQYFDWIRREVGDSWSHGWVEHDLRAGGVPPGPGDADGFIMTGSSSRIAERAEWMLRAEDLLRAIAAEETPFFGICFGHQMFAQALGGEVGTNPRGREIGTIEVTIAPGADDPILEGIAPSFRANATHLDTVVKLPPGARVLASNAQDPHQAFALGASVKCVQFHPEIDGDAMRGFVEGRAHLIEAEGGDAKRVLGAVDDTPESASTHRNFVRRVVR